MIDNIGEVKVNYKYYSGVDLYSDGKIEEDLLHIAQTYKEQDLEEFVRKTDSWPIVYHFSTIRGNIVESLPIGNEDDVLEIGAGCGAITGTLASKARHVTCIELSKQRSLINAYRNDKYSNIEIMVGNFQDIESNLQQKFDYITLIGVFEYAASYITGSDSYFTFICKIMEHLKENGKIVIAIENKFGMKYWSGAAEDHVGRVFEGIEDYSSTTGVKTFSKMELEELMDRCGVTKRTFYYPYPDYKFPRTIYSDDFLPKFNEIGNAPLMDQQMNLRLFDEKKAFNNILKNNLFPLYSNSYLIVGER